jgi:hypothetical protein
VCVCVCIFFILFLLQSSSHMHDDNSRAADTRDNGSENAE